MERGQSTLETLEMKVFNDIYHDTSVLVTGHTGFKGSWLALWLKSLGTEITGLGLEPNSKPCHWDLLNLDIIDKRIDIRDAQKVKDTINIATKNCVSPGSTATCTAFVFQSNRNLVDKCYEYCKLT